MRPRSIAGMAATSLSLGIKLDKPAIKAKVSMSGNPIIHKPKAVCVTIKKKPKI